MQSKSIKVADRTRGPKRWGIPVTVHNPGAAEVSRNPIGHGLYKATTKGHSPMLVNARDWRRLLNADASTRA